MNRRRADVTLVEAGLFDSRAKAAAAIAAGQVTADGVPVAKASAGVRHGAVLKAAPAHPWVSRGGVKLAAALDAFEVDPGGRACLDVGASTGGFTHVLLARGARSVLAIDVGHGQMHASLRDDPRVTVREGTDARSLSVGATPNPFALLVCDVSFISLRRVLPAVLGLAERDADLVALVKPQFEAGPGVARKGIVRETAVHDAVCRDIADLVRGVGWTVTGLLPSPITGGDGNREFLLGARRSLG